MGLLHLDSRTWCSILFRNSIATIVRARTGHLWRPKRDRHSSEIFHCLDGRQRWGMLGRDGSGRRKRTNLRVFPERDLSSPGSSSLTSLPPRKITVRCRSSGCKYSFSPSQNLDLAAVPSGWVLSDLGNRPTLEGVYVSICGLYVHIDWVLLRVALALNTVMRFLTSLVALLGFGQSSLAYKVPKLETFYGRDNRTANGTCRPTSVVIL
jgi:hypothetical protein